MKKYSMELSMLFRFGALALVIIVWVFAALMRVGLNRAQLLWPQPAVAALLLIVGWQAGWLLVEMDKYLKTFLKGNPQVTEFMVQWNSGLRNVVTLTVLVILGFWLLSSSNSVLAWGVVLGVQGRLISEFLTTGDFKKWYSVLGREFNEREHKGVQLAAIGLFVVQLLLLIRG